MNIHVQVPQSCIMFSPEPGYTVLSRLLNVRLAESLHSASKSGPFPGARQEWATRQPHCEAGYFHMFSGTSQEQITQKVRVVAVWDAVFGSLHPPFSAH